MNQGFLVLSSGPCFAGEWRGPQGEKFWRAGEVVFNTSHTGYEEIATDPSYFSQIIIMTAPMQGNYGVQKSTWESRKFWIEGFVATQIYHGEGSAWLERLSENKVPVLSDLDTREIVMCLRQNGTQWGALVEAENPKQAFARAQVLIEAKKNLEKDWCCLVSRKQVERQKGMNPKGPRIAVLDFGVKENILRELKLRCSQVDIWPSRTEPQILKGENYDGILLSNGPGDPADVLMAQETVRFFLGKLPIFGICMGHQILGLALGAKTYKMKFGHRGANHPIRDSLLQQVYMSSQNHGYALDQSTLPNEVQVTQMNLNDQTVAGIYSEKLKCMGIQYHPESRPGPHESVRLFDYFIENLVQKGAVKNG